MIKNKKSQAAVEYLMTYGWAILIVLISLGALFYLGVFSPKAQNVCSVGAPFTCLDVKIAPGTGNQKIQLGAGGAATSLATTTPLVAHAGSYCLAAVIEGGNANFRSGDDNTILLSNCGTPVKGEPFSGKIDITYNKFGGFTHTVTLEYSGTVE